MVWPYAQSLYGFFILPLYALKCTCPLSQSVQHIAAYGEFTMTVQSQPPANTNQFRSENMPSVQKLITAAQQHALCHNWWDTQMLFRKNSRNMREEKASRIRTAQRSKACEGNNSITHCGKIRRSRIIAKYQILYQAIVWCKYVFKKKKSVYWMIMPRRKSIVFSPKNIRINVLKSKIPMIR